MRKTLAIAAAALVLAGCSSPETPQQAPETTTPTPPATAPAPAASSAPAVADNREAVRSVVERFGRQMQKVSTLAPPDAMRGQLKAVYGDLLSPELLAKWQAHPDQAVGRAGSSPWPRNIEIKSVDCDGGTCRVSGDVAYITSNEVEHGGVFMRQGISLDLAQGGNGWRITAVHLGSAPE